MRFEVRCLQAAITTLDGQFSRLCILPPVVILYSGLLWEPVCNFLQTKLIETTSVLATLSSVVYVSIAPSMQAFCG